MLGFHENARPCRVAGACGCGQDQAEERQLQRVQSSPLAGRASALSLQQVRAWRGTRQGRRPPSPQCENRTVFSSPGDGSICSFPLTVRGGGWRPPGRVRRGGVIAGVAQEHSRCTLCEVHPPQWQQASMGVGGMIQDLGGSSHEYQHQSKTFWH